MIRPSLAFFFLLFSSISAAPPAPAQEWTRFRGPNGSGLSEAESIPVQWTEGDYNWKAELPGVGHSQPVLWGEKIFLTSAIDKGLSRIALCLRARDGGIEWTRKFEASAQPIHTRNTHATSTPAVDQTMAYFVFSTPSTYTLAALDHDGHPVWSRDFGPFQSQHGNGSSPVIFGDMIVLADEQDGASSLIAVERKSGELKWRTSRRTAEVAYGTPCVFLAEGGKTELIFSSHAHGISSIDPANGQVNWEANVFDKRTVSSPIVAGGLVISTCGSGGGGNILAAVRPGGKGNVTETHVAYQIKKSVPYVPTLVAKGDLLFMWSDIGVVSCVEVSTGNIVWQDRVGGSFSGSPVCVKDRLYSISDDGEVVVVEASKAYKLLARNPLGEGSRSTPAVAGGRMYLRTYSHLISVGGKSAR